MAAAEAERERGVVRAPWSGVVSDVSVEVGQAAFSMAGREIATLVALDPMLAVVEVAERKLAGIKVGDTADVRLVTGELATGKIRFVAKTASQTTRTYRVEIELPNADAKIPDGITAEVAMPLSPTPATRIPRSALTFSSTGNLGVRAVGADETVEFVPVNVVEDEQGFMWVTGIAEGTFYRDQASYFYQLGRYIERADQTTRLLDTKYPLLTGGGDAAAAVEIGQWHALLRSASGYHAFRRVHSSELTPTRVAGFLLFNPAFPRSVYLCVREAADALAELKSRYRLRAGNDISEGLDQLRTILESRSIDEILAGGLHEFLDFLQGYLIVITDRLSAAFFGHKPASQSQQASGAVWPLAPLPQIPS